MPHEKPAKNALDKRLNATARPIANPSLVFREEFDDWAILFDPDTGEACGLNPVSAYIWKKLDGRHTIDDIHQGLLQDCDHVPENAGQDIALFVETLLTRGYAGFEAE